MLSGLQVVRPRAEEKLTDALFMYNSVITITGIVPGERLRRRRSSSQRHD